MTETSPEPIDDGSAGTPTPRHFYRLLVVSGTIMWLRRRPTRVLGAPPMPANFPVWKTAVAIIIVMGLLFPLVGLERKSSSSRDHSRSHSATQFS
jgi:hypothetical protein